MAADDRIRVKKRTVEALLQECQRALQLFSCTSASLEDIAAAAAAADDDGESVQGSTSPGADSDTEELRDLLKSRMECPDFRQKLENLQASVLLNLAEEGGSWDLVGENDLWEGGNLDVDEEDYVLVRQDDIVDGLACFIAAYLLSQKQTKDLAPHQLQAALSKTFSVKNKKKGKLRRTWDGGLAIYNLASWGATAIGIYQNPAVLKAASAAFWTSCGVISKLF